MRKSKAVNIPFIAYEITTGAPMTGLDNITITLSKDGGAPAVIERTITELGNGWYSIALTVEDTTADMIVLNFTASDAVFPSIMTDLDDYADAAALTSTASTVIAAGDARWVTATGFATSSQLEAAASGIITEGNNNWITATQTTLSTSTKESIAKYVLKTSMEDVESTAAPDSLAAQVLATFHSNIANDGTWTIKKTNDQDVFMTKQVITNANAQPVTGIQDHE